MDTPLYQILLLVSLVLLGGMLGIFALYSHTIMPGLRKTDDGTFVKAFQAIDRRIVNGLFMIQFFGPMLVLGVCAYCVFAYPLAGDAYVYIALLAYGIAVGVTMAVNVPLNDGIKAVVDTTSALSASAARKQFQERRWTQYNHLRVIATLVAVIAVVLALLVNF